MQLPHEVYRLVGEVDIKHILPQMSFYHYDKGMKVRYRVPWECVTGKYNLVWAVMEDFPKKEVLQMRLKRVE